MASVYDGFECKCGGVYEQSFRLQEDSHSGTSECLDFCEAWSGFAFPTMLRKASKTRERFKGNAEGDHADT